MTAPGQQKKKVKAKDLFKDDELALWEELYDWGLRVRRDIMGLEVWAKNQGYQIHGGPDDSREATQARIDLRLEQLKQNPGDPGDPPGGPFDSE